MDLDPVVLSLGPVEIRWLTLAYVVGFAGSLVLVRRRLATSAVMLDRRSEVVLVIGAVIAVVVGTRLAYVVLYNPWHYVEHPLRVLMV